jgi:SAM-dependent methyltransferase
MISILQKVRNIGRGMLQVYGPSWIKKHLWNSEFSKGRWTCLDASIGDCVYPFIEKYAKKGSILDLGCGAGNTGNEIDHESYQQYTGVDISEVALEFARIRSCESQRADKNNYIHSDIGSFRAVDRYDVILFRDSIYYMQQSQIVLVLNRYARCLKDGGVLIVRMYDGSGKYQGVVDAIEVNFRILERHQPEDSKTLVLVFCPLQAL